MGRTHISIRWTPIQGRPNPRRTSLRRTSIQEQSAGYYRAPISRQIRGVKSLIITVHNSPGLTPTPSPSGRGDILFMAKDGVIGHRPSLLIWGAPEAMPPATI